MLEDSLLRRAMACTGICSPRKNSRHVYPEAAIFALRENLNICMLVVSLPVQGHRTLYPFVWNRFLHYIVDVFAVRDLQSLRV